MRLAPLPTVTQATDHTGNMGAPPERQVEYSCMQDQPDNFILIFLQNKDTVEVLQFSMIRRDL